MPRTIESLPKGFIPSNRAKRALVEVASYLAFPYITVEGEKNLKKAEEVSKKTKVVLSFASSHESHSDAVAHIVALRRNGHKELASNIIFLLGSRIVQDKAANLFSNAFPTIRVHPMTEMPEDESERKAMAAMNILALRTAGRKRQEGKVIFTFPEGTRSRDGEIGRGVAGVLGYLKDTLIIPARIRGTQKIHPIGKPPSFMTLLTGNRVTVSYGEAILFSDVKSKYSNLPNEERKQLMIDDVVENYKVL